MEPTTNQILCKDGSPAVTYDGVVITADGEYWAIPELEPSDFQELPVRPSEIPNKAYRLPGQGILDYCEHDPQASVCFASTREKANTAAVEKYLKKMRRRIEAAKQELDLFERYHAHASFRLSSHETKSQR